VEKAASSRGDPLFIYIYGPGFSVVGRIVALGTRLISYECMEPGKAHPREVNVDLFSSKVGFHVQRLPCLLVAHSWCFTGGKLKTVPMRRYDLKVVPIRTDHRAGFADLAARAHVWEPDQVASEPQTFQAPRRHLHRPSAQLGTFREWFDDHCSEGAGMSLRGHTRSDDDTFHIHGS
jgi:hypothetical protein